MCSDDDSNGGGMCRKSAMYLSAWSPSARDETLTQKIGVF